MLDKWLKIGKRRKKLIDKIIALDSSRVESHTQRRTLEQLSKWTVRNLERELFLLEKFPKYIPSVFINNNSLSAKTDERITRLINHAKANSIWEDNPKKGKWL